MPGRLSWVAIAALSLIVAEVAWPHHSTRMFDSDNPIELSGTVVDWQFSNPHVFIMLEVVQKNGERQVWALEGLSTNVLRRQGWDENSLQPGDEIIATVHPLHSGVAGGSYAGTRLRWSDGAEIDPTEDRR